MAGKRRRATTRVTVREEVSVMEVYWQLILWTGCTRFAGHDTLPSRPATGKPTRDVLRRRTESNLRISCALRLVVIIYVKDYKKFGNV